MPETSTTLLAASEVYGDELVHGLALRGGVVLAHGDDAVAGGVNHHVRVAVAVLGRQGLRLSAWLLPVEPLVGEVGEVDRAFVDGEVAAAVLVDAGARVEGPWGDVFGTSVRGVGGL